MQSFKPIHKAAKALSMPNNFLLSKKEQYTSHRGYIGSGIVAGKHIFVVLSYYLSLSNSIKLGPGLSTCTPATALINSFLFY